MSKSFLLLLFIPFTYAIAGGETIVLHTFTDCYNTIYINVTGELPIVEGEYNLRDCSQEKPNYWECNCTEVFPLIMDTHEYAVNNYTFRINYNYVEDIVISTNGGGSTSKGCPGCYISFGEKRNVTEEEIPEIIITRDDSKWVNRTPENDTTNITPPVQDKIPAKKEEGVPDESYTPWYIATLWIIVLLLIILYSYYKLHKDEKD